MLHGSRTLSAVRNSSYSLSAISLAASAVMHFKTASLSILLTATLAAAAVAKNVTVTGNDNAAIDSAIADATANSMEGSVYFPSGIYYYTGSMFLPANKSYRIYGDGPGVSTIVFTGNPYAGIAGTAMGTATLQVEGLTLRANSQHCGTAIWAEFSENGGNTKYRTATIRNVEIASGNRSFDNPPAWWGSGIILTKAQNAIVENVQIHGKHETSDYGIWWRSSNDYGTTQIFLDNIFVHNYRNGIATSGWVEGFYLSNFELVFCGSATTAAMDLRATNAFGSQSPEFIISNGHNNCLSRGLYMENLASIAVSKVTFFNQKYDGSAIELVNCLDAIISQNKFGALAGYSSNFNGIYARNADLVNMTQNTFRGMPAGGSCVLVDNASEQVKVTDNLFRDVSTKYNVPSHTYVREN